MAFLYCGYSSVSAIVLWILYLFAGVNFYLNFCHIHFLIMQIVPVSLQQKSILSATHVVLMGVDWPEFCFLLRGVVSRILVNYEHVCLSICICRCFMSDQLRVPIRHSGHSLKYEKTDRKS